MPGALPEEGHAKPDRAALGPEAGKSGHFTRTQIIIYKITSNGDLNRVILKLINYDIIKANFVISRRIKRIKKIMNKRES